MLFLALCYFITGHINHSDQMQENPIIYVYCDQGAGEECLFHTLATLKTIVSDKYIIKGIKCSSVISGKWTRNAALFVMPGGADLPYVKKLNGKGNEIIKKYVQNGGSYLGICAGAYYGSGFVEFDKKGPLEVLGARELQFFSGKSIGPVLAKYDYTSNRGVRAANIIVYEGKAQKEINLFFNGGCGFEIGQKFEGVSIVGWYKKAKNLPAILHIKYGNGNVILSGVHFEYDDKFLDTNDEFLEPLVPLLRASAKDRQELTKTLLKLLNIDVRHE